MNKTLLRKIRRAAYWGWDSSKIARYFGISRYRVNYVLGRSKRSPRAFIGLLERFIMGGELEEGEEEREEQAKQMKREYNQQIIMGKFNEENPVEVARDFREKFKRIFNCLPEEIK